MKRIVLFLGFLLSAGFASGQVASYRTVEYFTVDSVVYMLQKGRATMVIENALNDKGGYLYVYKDGTPFEGTWEEYPPSGQTRYEDFYRAIDETFSISEIESLKNSKTYLSMFGVFDDKGRMIECSFLMPMTAAAKSLPLERFATLERKMKQYVKLTITDERAKKIKYLHEGIGVNFWMPRKTGIHESW